MRSAYYEYLIMVTCLCILPFSYSRNRRNFVTDEQPIDWTVCNTFPGLNKAQQSVCRKFPDVTVVAMEGFETAIDECQHQFRLHRWNCSSLKTKNRNPRSNVLLRKGFRESAFSYAIAAAGVTHAVARACSMGKLMACGCEPKTLMSSKRSSRLTREQRLRRLNRNRWKWGGCSHNIDFGVQFSKLFLDVDERKSGDIQSLIRLHNSEAGRLAVLTEMQVKCKCHGMSGSCELKTCWKSAPDFRVVGNVLKERFRKAILVNQSNLGNNGTSLFIEPKVGLERKRRSRFRENTNGNYRRKRKRIDNVNNNKVSALDLFYHQKSPNFCEKDAKVDFPGTVGRLCNRTSHGMDNCSSLCCGRGYNVVKQKRIEKCNCRFHWCCYVTCQNCTVQEWITVCN